MSGHRCPAIGCSVENLPESTLACRPHWYALPADLRARIWKTFRAGHVVAHRRAVVEAIAFWRDREGAPA